MEPKEWYTRSAQQDLGSNGNALNNGLIMLVTDIYHYQCDLGNVIWYWVSDSQDYY